MQAHYDSLIVVLSYVVAVIASYVALDMASRVSATNGTSSAKYWLGGGAVAMGSGIWSMHFVGMLAFSLPIPVPYSVPITFLSMVFAIIASYIALYTISHGSLSLKRLLTAGVLMGSGIVLMHYTGMAALQLMPRPSYDPLLFSLSVLIAIGASVAAMWISFKLKSETILSAFWKKFGSALVMGIAIWGMHFTSMAAAIFAPNTYCLGDPSTINHRWLALTVGFCTFLFLATTLLVSVFDARLAERNATLKATRLENEDLELRVQERTASLVKEIADRKQAQIDLQQAQSQLLDASRRAGMAEVATNVLHNVGNVLNSVNVSAGLVAERVQNSKAMELALVVTLLQEHQDDLANFIANDTRGKHLPVYLAQLSDYVRAEREATLSEVDSLRANIDHIKDIVTMQQNYAKVSGVQELVNPVDLVEDSLRMNAGALTRHKISVIREFETVPQLNLDKHKAMQILVNLVRNAKYACDESPYDDKWVKLRVANAHGSIKISVTDNGVGIPAENLTRIFSHGFTTRAEGHGFGLHSGALAAKELGGSLTAYSAGAGKGATFILELPLQTNTYAEAAYG